MDSLFVRSDNGIISLQKEHLTSYTANISVVISTTIRRVFFLTTNYTVLVTLKIIT